jgi:hypothetical protein
MALFAKPSKLPVKLTELARQRHKHLLPVTSTWLLRIQSSFLSFRLPNSPLLLTLHLSPRLIKLDPHPPLVSAPTFQVHLLAD